MERQRFSRSYILTKKELGKSKYGSVYITVRKEDNRSVAVKKVKSNQKLNVENEINFLSLVNDINGCIKMLDYYKIGNKFWIVMEYPPESITLKDFLSQNKCLSEYRVANIFRHIVITVLEMKHAGVAHRSLRCENILIDKNDRIKIVDFSIAAEFDKADEKLGYVDWELNITIDPVTTWSLGIILGALLIGKDPYDFIKNYHPRAIKHEIFKKLMDSKISGLSQDLLRNCLDLDSLKRPSASEILQRHWLDVSYHPTEDRYESRDCWCCPSGF
ncbi:hypothetical protein QYM36_006018 [Artemia franciscana]|uniref:Protein kinase domain-containing protein n=1 Tax=Artemia franciscana TaxID=6661 RepID=A0AA88I2U4_ARTSF|nr:hypothetical protein QYM36_006018 [Artemia franciscana]